MGTKVKGFSCYYGNCDLLKSLISIEHVGHGHKKISMMFRNKLYSCVTSNMPAVDDYRSDLGERDGRELRVKRGYKALRAEIISKNCLK